jgi:hypothetical protein
MNLINETELKTLKEEFYKVGFDNKTHLSQIKLTVLTNQLCG